MNPISRSWVDRQEYHTLGDLGLPVRGTQTGVMAVGTFFWG